MLSSTRLGYLTNDHLNIYQVVVRTMVRQVARRGVRVSDQLVAALLKSVFQVKESTQWKGLKSTLLSYRTLTMGLGARDPWTGTT